MFRFQLHTAAAALMLISGLAAAQSQPKQDEPALKGPEVKDNSLPGQKRTFGEGTRDRKAGDRPTPLPVIMKAVELLRSEKAGADKVSADQDAKLKAVFEEFQTSTREYLEKNRDEIAALRAQLSPEDRAKFDQAFGGQGRALKVNKAGFKGKAPKDGEKKDGKDAPDEPMAPMADAETSAKARARLMEIYAGRPKPEDAQAKAWAVLTEAQRKLVQDEIAKVKQESERRAAKPDAAMPADLKNKTADEIMNDPRLPERLRERLKNMTPEDREKAIQRLKERVANPKKERGGEDKPAPSSTDVMPPARPK